MDYISLVGISIGLAMDAFAVSISNGAIIKKIKFWNVFKIAFCFGLFQAFMPIIGWSIGKFGESFIEKFDHWIAFFLLLYIGGKMIYDSKKDNLDNCNNYSCNSFKTLILLSIATSIDALATGIILPSGVGATTTYLMIVAVLIIGIITFFISLFGIYLGKNIVKLKFFNPNLLGGIILVLIGVKILIEHLLS